MRETPCLEAEVWVSQPPPEVYSGTRPLFILADVKAAVGRVGSTAARLKFRVSKSWTKFEPPCPVETQCQEVVLSRGTLNSTPTDFSVWENLLPRGRRRWS